MPNFENHPVKILSKSFWAMYLSQLLGIAVLLRNSLKIVEVLLFVWVGEPLWLISLFFCQGNHLCGILEGAVCRFAYVTGSNRPEGSSM